MDEFTPFEEAEVNCLVRADIKNPFVFLETAHFDLENNKSFLFSNFYDFLIFRPGDEPALFFEKIENYLRAGFWLAGFFSYEFGYCLEPSLWHLNSKSGNFPLAWLGVSRSPLIFYHNKKPRNFKKVGLESFQYELRNLSPNIDRKNYQLCIERIKNYIEEGLTYQVNFTYKYKFDFRGDVVKFYLNLRRAQFTSYMALLHTGKEYLLSLSPELFFYLKNRKIKVRPMKGTVSRGYSLDEDRERGFWLQNDEKNRAENVMIVDLLRNDLGRISNIGSVKVEKLFEVETYRTLHQMTSSIKSLLKKGTHLEKIFQALFPSGSVTGAPKISTMKIIAELEKEPRNIYTGAIGYLSPSHEACFNVAIRTILLKDGKAELGVGGGIVYDSLQNLEYEEANLKANFLIQGFPKFSLIETLRWERGRGFWFLDLHLRRISNSAEYFQIPLDLKSLRQKLMDLVKHFKRDLYRVRILLDFEGKVSFDFQLLDKLSLPVKVKLSSQKIVPDNPFLYHKTTFRSFYERERAQALREGFFEVIFVNTRGELTEGSISNIFLSIQRKLFTPALKSGLLPGVFRQYLLEKGQVIEKVLYPEDLIQAQKIYIGNSVRGLLTAEVKMD